MMDASFFEIVNIFLQTAFNHCRLGGNCVQFDSDIYQLTYFREVRLKDEANGQTFGTTAVFKLGCFCHRHSGKFVFLGSKEVYSV